MESVLLLRFDELEDTDRPRDAVENLRELAKTGGAMPAVVDAAVGRGRAFVSADGDGLAAVDVDSGATLLTRDASIQAIARWDIVAADAYGSPQTIYARGRGTAAAEYVGAGLELRVVNAALRIGELRWIWHDLAGVLKTQIGGHFQVPADGFLMFTATRRWISSSRVVLRYYLADVLLAEVESVDGSIGGGTTGTTQIGTRYTGAAYGRFFDGVIDELRVTDYELAPEEVEATWKRITVEQPRGYQLVREAHDPGFPISQDPSSRVQRETRMWGHALGYAAAQAENVRQNTLPDRAYGAVLERWERITKQSPRAGDDLETRRRRVIGRIRQRRGVSIPGVGDALAGPSSLLDTEATLLEVKAYDNTIRPTWSSLGEDGLFTYMSEHGAGAGWNVAGGALTISDEEHVPRYFGEWHRARTSIVDFRGALFAAKISIGGDFQNGTEVGIMFEDRGNNHAILLGYRQTAAGVWQLITEHFLEGFGQGATVRAVVDGSPRWVILEHEHTGGAYAKGPTSSFAMSYSSTGAPGSYTKVPGILTGDFGSFQWAGFYARTSDLTLYATTFADASFSEVQIRTPYGDRPFRFYVYRDPTDPGSADVAAAQAVLDGLSHAFTVGGITTSRSAICDSEHSPYDMAPTDGDL